MNVEVTTRGSVPPEMVALAEERIGDLESAVGRELGQARVVLLEEENPSITRSARAEGEISLGGKTVRGRVEAENIGQAISELAERLQIQLRRHIDRLTTLRRQPTETPEGKWRHGTWIPPRPAQSVRPAGEREVIRRKVFVLEPLDATEAAAVMEELDHNFYLFHDSATGSDSVVYRRDDGRLAVIAPRDVSDTGDHAGDGEDEIVRERSHFSGPLSLADAVSQMDELNHRFMYFIDAGSDRGAVLYLRYDGHYGLIEPDA